ncbi:ABC transporter substrate-binding protein (plasmid) [Rhizobium leguminosarum]|jgi:ABC-type branched-subunit amino acid transport system substrate-binding protein
MATIGLLLAQTGPLALWTPSCLNAAVLGIAEANADGGILGHEIDIVTRDASWAPIETVNAAREMVEDDDAAVIVGLIGSNSRDAVSEAIHKSAPLVYTPTYELGHRSHNTISISSTDDELVAPLLAFIEGRFGARRFYIVGSDYRWGRQTMPMTAGMIHSSGGTVVGMRARPINAREDWDADVIEDIRAHNPDVVLVFLVGDQGIPFYRAFAQSGLAAKIPRCAVATDETVLLALGHDATEGIFACAHYFASARTSSNMAFMEKYWGAFGEYAPIPNAYGQSVYEGISYSIGLMQAARSTFGSDLVHARFDSVRYRSARFDTPQGSLLERRPIYIAEANGLSFDIIARY